MGIPIEQYDAMERRLAAKRTKLDPAPTDAIGAGQETKLHQDIEDDLRYRRWLFIHSRTDTPTTTQLGVPDFTIFPPDAKGFFIECKTVVGKQTANQRGFQLAAELSGYSYHIVRSFSEYQRVIQQNSSKTADEVIKSAVTACGILEQQAGQSSMAMPSPKSGDNL